MGMWRRRLPRLLPRLIPWTLILLTAAPAAAQELSPSEVEGPMCTASQELDRYKLLRRLSLDLRNQVPSYEEYLALDDQEGVPESTIDAWLAGDAFKHAMRRFHEALLWPNLQGVQLTETDGRLVNQQGGGEVFSLLGRRRRQAYRKGNGTEACGDWEQTEFDAQGRPVAQPTTKPDGTTYMQEGWVEVAPYWDPDNPIKVCAFDAQTAPKGLLGLDCGVTGAERDPGCGCGPGLRHCYGMQVEGQVHEDLREQLLRHVDSVTVGGRPYTELITGTHTWVNGRLSFWKKYLASIVTFSKAWNEWGPGDPVLPDDPQWTGDDWQQVERAGQHAGIQTLGAFLLRFQTNRGRANRFRTVFTHQYFIPSAGEDEGECVDDTTDLTVRCGCRTCHQVLEPLAGHFAPFVEAGTTPFDHARYPIYDPDCQEGQGFGPGNLPNPACIRFYVMDPDEPNTGTLIPWQYADGETVLHQSIADAIEEGPAGLAASAIDAGLYASATVRNLWRYLMGRDFNLDPSDPDNEIALLADLAEDFRAHDDFPTLVRQLVALPQYRRIR